MRTTLGRRRSLPHPTHICVRGIDNVDDFRVWVRCMPLCGTLVRHFGLPVDLDDALGLTII
jgi:hypothetical protein